jgi:hypothetical protein
MRSFSDIIDQEAHALVVRGIEPEHPGELGSSGFLYQSFDNIRFRIVIGQSQPVIMVRHSFVYDWVRKSTIGLWRDEVFLL